MQGLLPVDSNNRSFKIQDHGRIERLSCTGPVSKNAKLSKIVNTNMLWRAKKLRGYTPKAIQGRIGTVSDLFFHDQTWCIENLLIKLGTWPHSKEVLIGAEGLGAPLQEEKEISIPLTKAQIEQSPLKGTVPPVSQQEPIPLQTAHHDPPFLGGPEGFPPVFPGMQPGAIVMVEAEKELMKAQRHMQKPTAQKPHLRSIKEVVGYTLVTSDGKKVRMEDFMIEMNNGPWLIRWVIASEYKWWPGKRVLLGTEEILKVDCGSQTVQVELTHNELSVSPEIDSLTEVNR